MQCTLGDSQCTWGKPVYLGTASVHGDSQLTRGQLANSGQGESSVQVLIFPLLQLAYFMEYYFNILFHMPLGGKSLLN